MLFLLALARQFLGALGQSAKVFLKMYNMKMEVKGSELIITVDLTKKGKASATGKSLMIASSEGNASVNGKPEVKVGLNVYTPVGV